MILSLNDTIDIDDLPPEIKGDASLPPLGRDDLSLAEMERRFILETLERCEGNQVEAARQLGVARSTLWRKLKEYGVEE
jgi:transcriptional regulator of acetoin/glycerol metabolism